MNKVWNMGLSSSFSFSKLFFLLMVLMVSSSSPSNNSPSPREPKNQSSSGFFRSLAIKPSVILRVLGLGAFFCLVTYLLPMVGS